MQSKLLIFKRILYICCFLFLITNFGLAKSFRFITGFGYANSDLSALKKAFKVPYDIQYPMKITDNYPIRPFFSFSVSSIYEGTQFGLNTGYFSTGARMVYSDYSGEHSVDNIVTYLNYGAFFKFSTAKNDSVPLSLNICLSTGLMCPEIKIVEKIRIFDFSDQTIDKISKTYVYLDPGIELTYKYNMLVFGLQGSYLIELNNPLTTSANGLRLTIFAGIDL